MRYLKDALCNIKWMFEDILLMFKHPTRKMTYTDFKYHYIEFWNNLFIYPISKFKTGIKNLITWFPLIWNNYIWDYDPLFSLIDKQLELMEKMWKKKSDKERINPISELGWRCQHRRIYKQIKWTRIYLKLVRDEYYPIQAYYQNKVKFPKEPKMFEYDKIDYDKYNVPISYRCKPMSINAAEDFSKRMNKAQEQHEKVFKLFWKKFSKIRGWWD